MIHKKTVCSVVSILFGTVVCGCTVVSAVAQETAGPVYCDTVDDLYSVFADAQYDQKDRFGFQCSDALYDALVADGSDILFRAEYQNNITDMNISMDSSGTFEVSDPVYEDVFCADCGSSEDIAEAFSSYAALENRPEMLVLFVSADVFPALLEGDELAVKALQAGFEDYQVQYSEQAHLFIIRNIICTQRSEEENTVVASDAVFLDLMTRYAAAGQNSFLVTFDPGYFAAFMQEPEKLDQLIASTLLDHYSWQINENGNFIQFGDVSWLVSSIPFSYVENEEDYVAAIDRFAEKQVTRFAIVCEQNLYENLMADEELLRSIQLSSRISTYESSLVSSFHYIRYNHVTFNEVPSHFCSTFDEFVEYLQTVASQENSDEAVLSEYRVSFTEDLYHQLMDNGNAGLFSAEEKVGLINYSEFYYSDRSYTITYENPEFAANIVSVSTIEEADAYFASLSMDADPKQVLHCTDQLYQELLTDEKDHSIDHTRISRLDDIMVAHGILASSYLLDEQRHFIILDGCTHYPGMRIVYARENGTTDFLTERERQTLDAALAFAGDARAQVSEGDPSVEGTDTASGETSEGSSAAEETLSADRELRIAAYIHDRLCRGIEYTIDESVDEDDTAIGALLNGEANCDGYADAFYLVGSLAGLTITYQHGESLDDEENYWKDETHLWNLLQIDGTWRLVDVTWDDSEEYGAEYTWFNIGLDRAERTHNWNHETGMPLLPQTDLSTRPDNEYTVGSMEEAFEAVQEAVLNNTEFYIYFTNEDTASGYEDILTEVLQTWQNITYSWNENMLLLRIYKQ